MNCWTKLQTNYLSITKTKKTKTDFHNWIAGILLTKKKKAGDLYSNSLLGEIAEYCTYIRCTGISSVITHWYTCSSIHITQENLKLTYNFIFRNERWRIFIKSICSCRCSTFWTLSQVPTTPKSNHFLTYKDKSSVSFSMLWNIILARADCGSSTPS